MKMKTTGLLSLGLIVLMGSSNIFAQKKAPVGKVCGDPTLPCKNAKGIFQPFDMWFDPGKNVIIAESEWFYAVILKSAKIPEDGECKNVNTEEFRIETQSLFPKHKVFATQCMESDVGYIGIPYDVTFMGVYAGKTLAEANIFLKTVKATHKFDSGYVKRIKVGFNGT